jgi:hypothetical protein
MSPDEVVVMLQNFRASLVSNQTAHQQNADKANADIALHQQAIQADQATVAAEGATVAEYGEVIGIIDGEIAKLTPPPSP